MKARPPATATTGSPRRSTAGSSACRVAGTGDGVATAGGVEVRAARPWAIGDDARSGRRARRPSAAAGVRPRRPSARSAAGTRPEVPRRAPRCRRRGAAPRAPASPVASSAVVDLGGVPRRAGLVQDHAGDPDGRVEGVQPVHDRRRGPRHRRDVEDQDHRRAESASRHARSRRTRRRRAARRTGPSRPRSTATSAGSGTGAPCSSSGTSWSLADTGAGRGCGRAGRWPARGSRGRCSPGRP